MQTIINTAWLYPISDVTAALATTTYPHTFDGDNIVVPNMAAFIGLYTDIYTQTAISQPAVNNPGYTIGVGTMLEDLGQEIRFILTSGQIIMLWRNVRQLTPQTTSFIPSPGNSPPDSIGFITTFASYGNNPPSADVDIVQLVRIG